MNFCQIKKKFNEIKEEFLNFIKNKRLIIHNAEFDIAHLNNELGLIGEKNLDNEIIDTLILARNKFPGSSVSLDALCKRYGVDNSRRKNHTALMDCDLLAKVYINLIDQREPTLNFEIQNENTINISSKNKSYYKKIIKPNAKELAEHREYLKSKLKKNYF